MFESKLRELYLDFVCNYITVRVFAEHNALTESDATLLIELGRKYHEHYVDMMKKEE